MFIVVAWREVDYGVDETEHQLVCSIVDDNVDGHVIGVFSHLVGVYPLWGGAIVP